MWVLGSLHVYEFSFVLASQWPASHGWLYPGSECDVAYEPSEPVQVLYSSKVGLEVLRIK